MRIAITTYTILFALSGHALAAEPVNEPTGGNAGALGANSEITLPPTPPREAPILPPPAPVEVVTHSQAESSEPVIGWSRGSRAPMYARLMLGAGLLGEDSGNRLTTRDSKALEGMTGVLRVGATLSEHSRLGARLQSFARPTKKLVYDTPPADGNTDKMGGVFFGFVGPEYLYNTDFGLYFGGSVGLAVAGSSREYERKQSDRKDIERGAGGLACVLSLGYEWRMSKWFAMNAEVYGGGYSAVDDDENSMRGGLFGFAMGAGF